jgi:outer membrane lipoprotein-sorting protein
MEKNKKTLLFTLALVFIGMFLIASVFATEEGREGDIQTVSTKVTQTYKSYETTQVVERTTYKSYKNTEVVETTRIPERTRYSNQCYGKDCSYNRDSERKTTNPAHYTYYAQESSRKGFLGDYVKEYSAYVTNKGITGRYFTVVFTLEDKNCYEFTQSVTQYLRTGEKKRFVYRDTQYERNEILHWDYDIVPQRY